MVIANVARGFSICFGLGNEINFWAGVRLNFDSVVGIVRALVGIITGIIIIAVGIAAGLIIRAGMIASSIVVIVLITAGTIVVIITIVVVVVTIVVVVAWTIVFAFWIIIAMFPKVGTTMVGTRIIRLRLTAVPSIIIAIVIMAVIAAIILVVFRFFLKVHIKELGHRVQSFSGKLLANFLETFSPLPRHGIEE